MKRTWCLRGGVAGLLLFLALASCKKSSGPSINPITPLQSLLNTDTSMAWFHRLLLVANQTALLADDSVTLLIPSNDAFRAAGYVIDSIGSAVATRLVRYHFINGRVLPESNTYISYSTLLGYNIYGMRDSTARVLFNGTAVTGDTLQVGKALVYRLDAPLSAAADSLTQLLAQDTSLSFFAEALLRTGLDTTLEAGNYTLLAPDNSAFMTAGYDSLGAIDSADINTLTQLAKNQVLAGNWFTNTLAGLSTVTTLQGNTITISLAGTVLQFTGSGNPVPANLLNGNRPSGNNIVLHRIDQVLR